MPSKTSSKREQGPTPLKLFTKFASVGSKPTPETFPELMDCIIWLRFGLALCYGIYLVTTEATGALKLVFGLNIVAFVPYFYTKWILLASEEFSGVLLAGVPNSMGLIVLMWIYGYSLKHTEDEERLMAHMAVKAMSGGGGNVVDTEESITMEETVLTPDDAGVPDGEQESEF